MKGKSELHYVGHCVQHRALELCAPFARLHAIIYALFLSILRVISLFLMCRASNKNKITQTPELGKG